MFVVTVEFSVVPGIEVAFRKAVVAQSRSSLQSEPECHQFDVAFAADQPGHVFLYEVYSHEAAFRSHLETEHFASFEARTRPWVREKKVATWLRNENA